MSSGRRARRRRRLAAVVRRVRRAVESRGFTVVEEAWSGSRVRLDLAGRTRASVVLSRWASSGRGGTGGGRSRLDWLVAGSTPSIDYGRRSAEVEFLAVLDASPSTSGRPVGRGDLREVARLRHRVPLADRLAVVRRTAGSLVLRSLLVEGDSPRHRAGALASADPDSVRLALSLLRDLDRGVPLEWVLRRVPGAGA